MVVRRRPKSFSKSVASRSSEMSKTTFWARFRASGASIASS